mmetsp:Transcript_14598/g.25860  ORF Transcript_14598/g.25860 Transcript_14598/m.25860 type:complete len:536 (-) Transcript_14598:13-1620(-)
MAGDEEEEAPPEAGPEEPAKSPEEQAPGEQPADARVSTESPETAGPGQKAEEKAEEEPEDVFPDLSRSKQLRRYELQCCAYLTNTVHLRQALAPGRSQRGFSKPEATGQAAAHGSEGEHSPLEAACQAGNLPNVRVLLKETSAGAEDLNSARPDRTVALAVDSGAADVVRLLVQSRARVNAASAEHRPPLCTAVKEGHLEIVKALCESPDADVNAQDARGCSALHEAVTRMSAEMVAELLARRADPASTNERGWTPVHLAAHLGNVDILGQLHAAGGPINGFVQTEAAAPRSATGMSEAPSAHGDEVASSYGRAVSAGGESSPSGGDAQRQLPAAGWTPLHLLISRGDGEAVQQLIVWRADACRTGGPDNMTPLMLAISLKQETVATQLLSLEPVRQRIDTQDRRGRCALHFAVEAVSKVLVRGLLQVNAAPTMRSQNGLTPIDMARSLGMHEDSEVLQQLQVEEVVRLVMLRGTCREQNKYEEAELLRGDLRIRGVSLDVAKNRWSLADGTWGYLSTERSQAQAQGGPRARIGK